MKTTITRKLLKKDYAARTRTLRRYFFYAVFFCALWLAFFPHLVSVLVTVIIMGAAFAIYAKGKRVGEFGDVRKAYFRRLPLSGKEETRHGDEEVGYSSAFWLRFGEHGEVEVLKFSDYKEAEEGQLYYVAFFSETDKPFACFDAEAYDLDPSFLLK